MNFVYLCDDLNLRGTVCVFLERGIESRRLHWSLVSVCCVLFKHHILRGAFFSQIFNWLPKLLLACVNVMSSKAIFHMKSNFLGTVCQLVWKKPYTLFKCSLCWTQLSCRPHKWTGSADFISRWSDNWLLVLHILCSYKCIHNHK